MPTTYRYVRVPRRYNKGWSPALLSRTTYAVITGTAVPNLTEADVVAGAKTIIITLTNDIWAAAGATFDVQRQAIINGVDSAQAEAAGWDAVVKATQGVAGVVRTSNTVVTITLDAFASYNITAPETITVTVPSAALVSSPIAVIGTPTFTVTALQVAPLLRGGGLLNGGILMGRLIGR